MIRKYIGIFVLMVLVVVPIIYWLINTKTVYTLTISSVFLLMGKMVALFGTVLFLINPILSMRYPVLARMFGGLDTLYSLHKQTGKLSFILLLCHPLFLGIGRLLGGKGLGSVWDWTSLLIISGLLGLVVMIGLTVLAIYGHMKHQRWIQLHRLFGLLIPLFIVHALIAKSQIYKLDFLKYYVVTLGVLGFSAFIYRSVLGGYLFKKYRYEVADVIKQRGNVTEIVLKPLGIPLSYLPGQFAFVGFRQNNLSGESHPYSFTTANNGPYLRFAIKALGDDTKDIANLLSPGTPASVEGPFGAFTLGSVKNNKQVWIAGGVGIAPFISMARSLNKNNSMRITLFYAAQKVEDAVFIEEIWKIAKLIPDVFGVFVIDARISGFVTTEMIANTLGDISTYDYLICGPPPMMKAVKKQLLDANIPTQQIHIEAFSM